MKILVISQQYWPESWRIVDTCEELVNHGYDVTVVCGLPNDSEGRVLKTYKKKAMRCQEHGGVHILRVADHPRWRGDFNLYRKYITFSSKGKRLAKHLPNDFDLVLINQLSPVMQALPGMAYARKKHCPLLMYCQDLWPESLSVRGVVDSGLTRPIYRHYLSLSRKIYQAMDYILVTSPAYVDYLKNKCLVGPSKLDTLEQYAEPFFFGEAIPDLHQAKEHNFVFAGNIGQAQDAETIIKAADLLKSHEDIRVHLVGDGSGLKKVERLANSLHLSNVIFHRRVPVQAMPGVYQGADALLITLSKDAFTSYVLPAKLTSYMASGKPIISACNGAVTQLISEAHCGVGVASGDFTQLAKEILRFSQLSSQERNEMGRNGRLYATAHFDREAYFLKLDEVITHLVHCKRPAK
jgi:glycosyltransferase involved in cell wall biosynthesis